MDEGEGFDLGIVGAFSALAARFLGEFGRAPKR